MRYYIVDAFADMPFSGNPAGVCLVDNWPGADRMQCIARENNLSETAFILSDNDGWHIRWFTPAFEIDLCGHATLASGFVVLNYVQPGIDRVRFVSQSGPLTVMRQGTRYVLDFPARPPKLIPTPKGLEHALGAKVLECRAARDLVILLESQEAVAALTPDFALLGEISGYMGFVPTASGLETDFVSRFFDPHDAIIEDPVTGSAHCSLVPFWSKRLGKETMVARQLSQRGGTLYCRDLGERVEIGGDARLYLEGSIYL